MKIKNRNVVITGASTGIGYSAVEAFLNEECHVYGMVRSVKDAKKLKNEFGEKFTPLIADVTDHAAIDRIADQLTAEIGKDGLSCLVNNAGIAQAGPLLDQSIEQIQYHFDVNVIGLIKVTKSLLPLLGAQKDSPFEAGKIINISSVNGKIAFPFVGAYVASKHAVEGYSHSLRRELLPFGIDVVIVGPGPVKTPIWDKGINTADYSDSLYKKPLERYSKIMMKTGPNGLEPKVIADRIMKIYNSSRPKTRYTMLKGYFQNYFIPNLLPDRMLDRMVGKIMRF